MTNVQMLLYFKPVAYPGFHLGSINFTQIMVGNFSHLLSCPFEVQCIAIWRYKSLYTPCVRPWFKPCSTAINLDKAKLHYAIQLASWSATKAKTLSRSQTWSQTCMCACRRPVESQLQTDLRPGSSHLDKLGSRAGRGLVADQLANWIA